MDTFDEAQANLAKATPDEVKTTLQGLRTMCRCPGCPTYTDCAKQAQERLFCATGGSFICITREVECICPTCPVYHQLGLKYDFYCTRGNEKSQRYDHR